MLSCCKKTKQQQPTTIPKNREIEIAHVEPVKTKPVRPTPANNQSLLPAISREIYNNTNIDQSDIMHLDEDSLAKKYLNLPEYGMCMAMNVISRQNFENSIIFRGPHSIRGGQFRAGGLKNTTVIILDETMQVNFDDCINCQFIITCCSGSIFLHCCHNCSISAVCGQFRCQSSGNCDIYIHCRTEPVIEFSSDLKFYPFAFMVSYSNISTDSIKVFKEKRKDYENSVAESINMLLYTIMYNCNLTIYLNRAGKVHDFSAKTVNSYSNISATPKKNFEIKNNIGPTKNIPLLPLTSILNQTEKKSLYDIFELSADLPKSAEPKDTFINEEIVDLYLPTNYEDRTFKQILTNKLYKPIPINPQSAIPINSNMDIKDIEDSQIVEENAIDHKEEIPMVNSPIGINHNTNIDLQIHSVNTLDIISKALDETPLDKNEIISFMCPVLKTNRLDAMLSIISLWRQNPKIEIVSVKQINENINDALVSLMELKKDSLSKILQNSNQIAGVWQIDVSARTPPKIIPLNVYQI